MKLITDDLKILLPPMGSTSEKDNKDIPVPVKFFDPVGSGTWYAAEYDPEEHICFGYVTGLGDNELGEFSLRELESIKRGDGLTIERDLYWTPRSLDEIIRENP